jgi:AcrR family transcriptional regulator
MSGDGAVKATTRLKAEAVTPRRRRPRGSLSREEILDAAREIVERDGLRQLSMPTLATHLKSGVTSIYWYFRNKDALVDALAQQVLSDVHQQVPPIGDGSWYDELITYFEAFHDLLQALPAYREVVAYGSGFIVHSALTGAAQRRLEAGLDLLVRAGLTRDEAFVYFGACVNYTRGFVVLQQGVTVRPTTQAAPEPDMIDELNRVDDARFRLGLRLLVGGIRADLASRDGSGRGRRPRSRTAV